MTTNWKGKQLSITSRQQETAAGAELLSLLLTVTSDGKFTEEELSELRKWLEDHPTSTLPGAAFLRDTVERVLADGSITPEEWDELQAAVVRVLPPAERPAAERAWDAERLAEWRKVEAERRDLQAKADGVWDFMVAGVAHEGRSAIVDRFLDPGDPVVLEREPANRFDRNAIAVRLRSGQQVGFVPARYAAEMAPLLDSGAPYTAWCKKILLGSSASIPVVVASLKTEGATRVRIATPQEAKPASARPSALRAFMEEAPTPAPTPTRRRASASAGQVILVVAGLLLLALLSRACHCRVAPREFYVVST